METVAERDGTSERRRRTGLAGLPVGRLTGWLTGRLVGLGNNGAASSFTASLMLLSRDCVLECYLLVFSVARHSPLRPDCGSAGRFRHAYFLSVAGVCLPSARRPMTDLRFAVRMRALLTLEMAARVCIARCATGL